MNAHTKHYWQKRLAGLKETLEDNRFEAFLAADRIEAKEIVLGKILPETGALSISRGDSLTCRSIGLFEAIKENVDVEFIDPFEDNLAPEERQERLRQSLLVDLFITGTNAVTETGMLVNLDKIGNRVGGITFGPKAVVILVGRNKVVPDLEEAMFRIKNFAAPANAIRLNKSTPCAKTSRCEECSSPERICNIWNIVEKSFPKGRVKVILINEDLGL